MVIGYPINTKATEQHYFSVDRISDFSQVSLSNFISLYINNSTLNKFPHLGSDLIDILNQCLFSKLTEWIFKIVLMELNLMGLNRGHNS